MAPGRDDSITKSPDQRGETIITSEMEILTSLDLAQDVVKGVGAEKILASIGGGRDATVAAMVVRNGLTVDVPPRSSVLRIIFSHPDAEVVQVVLRELVAAYLKKHSDIHRAAGFAGDFLTQETDSLRSRLAQTEEELRKATNKAGIISLEDYKRSSGEQLARTRQQVFDVQAELAERTSIFQQLMPDQAGSKPAEAPALVPPEQVEAYQAIFAKVQQLRQREQEALTQFTEESARVRDIRVQRIEAEQKKTALETQFPALLHLAASIPTTGSKAGDFNPTEESAHIGALQARLKMLNAQLEEIRVEAGKVDQLEITIKELLRRKELEETNYRYYSASLEQSRINEAIGAGRVSNISLIQTPTPPAKDMEKTFKLVGAIAAAGIVLGLAWAFAIELLFDRSIRRAADVEHTLQLPLFLSIPKTKAPKAVKVVAPGQPRLLDANNGSAPGDQLPAPPPPPGPDAARTLSLNRFHETLRDRLISYFDGLNVRHKPKLIAVTGLGTGSGVTTIAAGLARSFSETGEGNVLLIDMTREKGAAQHFHKGTPIGLEQLLDTQGSAFVRSHLYVVTESSSSERLAKGMPQRFNQLIPKLKASDFDYIIFDMPPVNQISITPRLAQFMDIMLMVLESEKTDRDLALHASALLGKSGTPVGVVLNKAKTYIPARLHKDHEFLIGS